MSKKFDADAYVSRWDDILIPAMLIVIFGSMAAAYGLNVWAKPDCRVHDYVFCGTPLDMPAEEHHASPGDGHHGAAGHGEVDAHTPAGGHGDGHNHGSEGGHDHPH